MDQCIHGCTYMYIHVSKYIIRIHFDSSSFDPQHLAALLQLTGIVPSLQCLVTAISSKLGHLVMVVGCDSGLDGDLVMDISRPNKMPGILLMP